jgi:D-proline reductase (dithiol) PrdB
MLDLAEDERSRRSPAEPDQGAHMPRLDRLSAAQRNRILMRPVPINDAVPWAIPPTTSAARLGLVTTGGLHRRTDTPFIKYDQTFRAIPSSITEGELLQSQSSIGFDRTLRMRDVNVVFPIDRLADLVTEGVVSSLARNYYSLVGAQEDSEKTAAAIGGELAPLLRADGVDAVLITPSCPVCTHTGAALARRLEEAGLPTVALSLVREYSQKARPPRTLYVPYPFGAPVGPPGETETQMNVLRAALRLFVESSGPVLADFVDERYESADAETLGPVQASAVSARSSDLDVANEVSSLRRYYDVWFEREHKTAVGLSGVAPTRFRGVVRFLEALVEGRSDHHSVVPDGVLLPEFVRYCADDLKAMYLEGRLVMRPGESPEDASRWLWGETALGGLLVRVREAMEASPDPALRDAAFGIAR